MANGQTLTKFAANFKVLGELETIVVSKRSCFEWSESTNHRLGDG